MAHTMLVRLHAPALGGGLSPNCLVKGNNPLPRSGGVVPWKSIFRTSTKKSVQHSTLYDVVSQKASDIWTRSENGQTSVQTPRQTAAPPLVNRARGGKVDGSKTMACSWKLARKMICTETGACGN